MTYALYNQTKQRWVRDADSDTGEVWTTVSVDSANDMLDRVNAIKQHNPANRNDNIIVKLYEHYGTTETVCH